MAKDIKSDFCIEIDFKRDSPNPSRVFQTMSNLIEAFQRLDNSLVQTIDSKIQPVVLLEDIETGSIKAWLRNRFNELEDDDLRDLNWQRIVGKYLVKSKYLLIDFLKDKTEITDRKQIETLEGQIIELAKETNVYKIPSYEPLDKKKLLNGIRDISDAVSLLNPDDKAFFVTKDEKKVAFNVSFSFAPERIEELITSKVITSTSEMILKVKKPDYLGDSMWEMKHDTRAIDVKIIDEDWLHKFQKRKIDIRPGDAIDAKVEVSVGYGHSGEVVSERYNILKVIKIIPYVPPPSQEKLFDE